VQQKTDPQGVTRLAEQNKKGGERQMTYLLKVANRRPMLRISGEIVLAFCCAAPLVLALTYGVQALIH